MSLVFNAGLVVGVVILCLFMITGYWWDVSWHTFLANCFLYPNIVLMLIAGKVGAKHADKKGKQPPPKNE